MTNLSGGILLVEDDRVDVMTVQRVLTRHAISIPLHVARTATEALAMLRGEGRDRLDPPPGLILLDLNLPRMSGIEFLQALRADPQLRNLTVIVLTSSNEPNDRAAAFRYEVEDYIVKPHSFEQFASAIQTIIQDLFGTQNG